MIAAACIRDAYIRLKYGALIQLQGEVSRTTVHGVTVVRAPGSSERAAKVVMTALDALSATSPTYWRWLQHAVQEIRIVNVKLPVAWIIAPIRRVFLSSDATEGYEPAVVAMLLAHEAAHARLYLAGIRPSPSDVALQMRVEHTCNRVQLQAIEAIAPRHPAVRWARNIADGRDLMWRHAQQRIRILLPVWRRWKRLGLPRNITRALITIVHH